MKKVLSLVLALLMLFSCMSVCATAQGNLVSNELGTVTSIDQLIADGASVYGIPVDFLYNSTSTLEWKNFDVKYPDIDDEGNPITVKMTKDDIALARGNINSYFKRYAVENYLGSKLFTSENATAIANFLGKAFNPNFTEVTIIFEDSVSVTEDQFYDVIVEKSGFGDIIQTNWCDTNVDFETFLTTVGVVLTNVLPREYEDGAALGKHILSAAIQKIVEQSGPVNYFLDLFTALVTAYRNPAQSSICKSITALFALKTNAGIFDVSDIQSVTGVLNAIFNDCDKTKTDCYQFIEMPESRMAAASGANEMSLYLMMYFTINYNYANNKAVVERFVGTTLLNYFNTLDLEIPATSEEEPAESQATVRDNILMAFDAILTGNLSEDMLDWMLGLTSSNIQALPYDFWDLILNSISGFFQRIAEWIDNMFKVLSGEKQYGVF